MAGAVGESFLLGPGVSPPAPPGSLGGALHIDRSRGRGCHAARERVIELEDRRLEPWAAAGANGV